MRSYLLKKISKVSLSLQKEILQKEDISFARGLLLKCAFYLEDGSAGNNSCEDIPAVQRDSEEAPRILFIDDRMPYDYLGAGYPRSRVILNILSKLKVNASFIPLGFTCNDSPSMIHSHFPDNIEYLLSLNKESIFSFLYKKRSFYDAIIISRPHNMEYLYGVLKYLKRYKPSLKIIYDAEALICYREILKQETLGQPFSTEKQKMLIDQEASLFSIADSIYSVSPSEKKLIQNFYPDTPILRYRLSVIAWKPTSLLTAFIIEKISFLSVVSMRMIHPMLILLFGFVRRFGLVSENNFRKPS